jgi:signal transduction histidine kinase/ActR/RegA family two-component response regulator
MPSTSHQDELVLVLAPTGKDAKVARDILATADILAAECPTLSAMCEWIEPATGALVIAQEALTKDSFASLCKQLDRQPPWSDIPVIVLTSAGEEPSRSERAAEVFFGRNVTLLERPFRAVTLISVVQTALRSRRRQYEVRQLLDQRTELLGGERSARAEAEAANHMKDEFLASLSHELRTPLNAILGWCQLLQTGQMSDEETREGLQIIERNTHIQTQLIDDLLDISRIISGKLRLDVQWANLADIVNAAVAVVMPSANAKGIRVQSLVDPQAGSVWGDPGRLQQVLWNLLTNAVKFTNKGGKVTIRLQRINSHVEISVADDGRGISPKFLPFVFDRFRQADASTTRAHGGLGLGLAIVRQLAELHGGSTRVHSEGEGRGAEFTIVLPIAAVDGVNQNRQRTDRDRRKSQTFNYADTNLSGLRVLVVDDDADARQLLERVLTACGADVVSASSADDAIAGLHVFDPHVLVSDIGMPQRDGYDLIRQIRNAGKNARDLPAVALTAFARSEDRQRALLAGFQMHVKKPVNPSELMAAVASLAGRTGTNQS